MANKVNKVPDGIELQNREFDAVKALTEQHRRLMLTAVVDDDYPELRHQYEGALSDLIAAMQANRPSHTELVKVRGSRAEVEPYMVIPHIAVTNKMRALRWHPNGLDSWSVSDWAVALAGECGELCNIVKKLNRERDDIVGNKENGAQLRTMLANEIADVYLYLDLFASRVGLALEEVIKRKFDDTSKRLGFPERL